MRRIDNACRIHAYKLQELFLTVDISKYKVPTKEIRKYFSDGGRKSFFMFIFRNLLQIIIDDIIEHGVQFQFPEVKYGLGNLWIHRYTGEEYRMLRKKGALSRFDPVEADFCGYKMVFHGDKKRSGTPCIRMIYLDDTRNDRIAELGNANKIKVGKIKDLEDYLDQIYAMFPTIDKACIKRFLSYGLRQFSTIAFQGEDISIKTNMFFLIQMGFLYKNERKMVSYIQYKLKYKIWTMYNRLRCSWDGYSYFIKNKNFTYLHREAIKNREKINFGKLYLYRCYDSALARASKGCTIFRVKDGNIKYRFYEIVDNYTPEEYEVEDVFYNWGYKQLHSHLPKCRCILNPRVCLEHQRKLNTPGYIKEYHIRKEIAKADRKALQELENEFNECEEWEQLE